MMEQWEVVECGAPLQGNQRILQLQQCSLLVIAGRTKTSIIAGTGQYISRTGT